METIDVIVSPKPTKVYGNTKNRFKLASSYDNLSQLNYDREFNKTHPKSTKNVATTCNKNTNNLLNETNSTNATNFSYTKNPNLELSTTKNPFNMFDEFEKDLEQEECHDEIFSILNDIGSTKTTPRCSIDINYLNFNCIINEVNVNVNDPLRVSVPLERPKNPVYKNFELRDDDDGTNVRKCFSEEWF